MGHLRSYFSQIGLGTNLSSITPERVRAIRGTDTRAAFAARLGVTVLTVYRWELPAEAPEARSPRGRHLAALRALDASLRPAVPYDALESALAAGEWSEVERRAMDVLAADTLSPEDHAFVVSVIAEARAIGRVDGSAAFLLVAPYLGGASLPPATAARMQLVAAAARLFGEGPLFHPRDALSHAIRATTMLDASPRTVARAGALAKLAMAMLGDSAALDPAFVDACEHALAAADPVTACLLVEAKAAALAARGAYELEEQVLSDAVVAAREAGFFASEARVLRALAQVARREGDIACATSWTIEGERASARASVVAARRDHGLDLDTLRY